MHNPQTLKDWKGFSPKVKAQLHQLYQNQFSVEKILRCKQKMENISINSEKRKIVKQDLKHTAVSRIIDFKRSEDAGELIRRISEVNNEL